MRFVGLTVVLSVIFSSAGAQVPARAGKAVVSAVTKNAVAAQVEGKILRQAATAGAVRVPYVPNPVTPAMLQQPLKVTGVTNPSSVPVSKPVQMPVAPLPKIAVPKAAEPQRYESPFRSFLQEDWEMPSIKQYEQKASAAKRASISAPRVSTRSLESLRMECAARGILPQNWESYSRDELAEFLSAYDVLEKGGGYSRFDEASQVDATGNRYVESARNAWVHKQPDFFKDNYINVDNRKHYTEPFNPQVTQLRILVVNDVKEQVAPLRRVAEQDGRVTLDFTDSVEEAMAKIKNNPYDIVLTDFHVYSERGTDLSMWLYKEKPDLPVVLHALLGVTPEWAYAYNFKGQINIEVETERVREVLNYASNLVATGKAYPNR